MIVPDVVMAIFGIIIVLMAVFAVHTARTRGHQMIQKVYIILAVIYIVWVAAVMLMQVFGLENQTALFILDAITNMCSGTIPVIGVLIALIYTRNLTRLPKRCLWFFAVPVLTDIMVWTNPLHHLMYQKFSVLAEEVVMGPYMILVGIYSYTCLILCAAITIGFALKNRSRLYIVQALLFSLGNLAPMVVSILATFKIVIMPIYATPLAFVVTIVLHGFAINNYNFLNITPVATQHILDWIADCYLVVGTDGLVVSYNQPFFKVFGERYGIRGNRNLRDCAQGDMESKIGLYNLLSSLQRCRETDESISYEQAIPMENRKRYYMVEIAPLSMDDQTVGYICIFKDVTMVKESMQRMQDSQARMMEQERLVSLGQMVGGIAHNLKTPIMSISGSTAAMENLVVECQKSIGDPDVTEQDYREITQEMEEWLQKVREACAYMSDIITAVKGQATNMNASEIGEFTVDELIKRVMLLMRHELVSGKCTMEVANGFDQEVYLHGDINNLVQVVNNLVSNAIDAQKEHTGGRVLLRVGKDQERLLIQVVDYGKGVPSEIKRKLFKEMVTSKGSMGTGMGVYMSNVVIRGKFGGEMYLEDNPEGGSIFTIGIPLKSVRFA